MSEELPALSTSADVEAVAAILARYVYGEADWRALDPEERAAVAEPYLPWGEKYAPMLAALSTPPPEGTGVEGPTELPRNYAPPTEGTTVEWGVRHSQGIATGYDAREWEARASLKRLTAAFERNSRNKVRPVIVTRRVTEWTEVTP